VPSPSWGLGSPRWSCVMSDGVDGGAPRHQRNGFCWAAIIQWRLRSGQRVGVGESVVGLTEVAAIVAAEIVAAVGQETRTVFVNAGGILWGARDVRQNRATERCPAASVRLGKVDPNLMLAKVDPRAKLIESSSVALPAAQASAAALVFAA
jgi:hypothetical protein